VGTALCNIGQHSCSNLIILTLHLFNVVENMATQLHASRRTVQFWCWFLLDSTAPKFLRRTTPFCRRQKS